MRLLPVGGRGLWRLRRPLIADFRSYPDGAEFDTDLCIIGSGPAGIALATEFLNSPIRVLLCESGGMQIDATKDELSAGESVGHQNRGLREGRARAFGGTSLLWAGQCIELDDMDFEKRPWVPHSGWPITKAVLAPYYQRAERFFGLSDEMYDERIWESFRVPAPALDPQLLGTKFTIYAPVVHVGRHVRSRFAASRNVRTLLNATVTKVAADEGTSTIRYAHLRSPDGKSGTVRARAFVLCCGGIETARLLLLSNDQERDGVGNRRGLVGRFLQDHPNARTADVVSSDPRRLQNIFNLFYRGRKRYFAKFPLSAAVQHAAHVLNCNAHLVYIYPEESGMAAVRSIVRAVRRRQFPSLQAVRRLPSAPLTLWSTASRRYLHGRSPIVTPSRIQLQCHTEQAPDPESRVSLSTERDRLQQPKARVDWRVSSLELETIRVMTDVVEGEFRRLNLGAVIPADWLREGDWKEKVFDAFHHIGTTRMAQSPDQGVVDPHLRVFDCQGLFVAGSAVFPTSGYANPTLTIVALALRLADHLKASVLIQ
jgi:choline dehydrogenase-like flavoprotein